MGGLGRGLGSILDRPAVKVQEPVGRVQAFDAGGKTFDGGTAKFGGVAVDSL